MYLLRTCTMRFVIALSAVMLVVPLLLADEGAHYQQTNLVSDLPGLAAHTDADLVNPFGLTRGAATPWWASDEGTGHSTLYNADGIKQALTVTVPPPPGSAAGTKSTPTGIISNSSTSDFMLGSPAGVARFIFATLDGTISGWVPALGTTAVIAIDNSSKAIYTGLTSATFNGETLLYAANHKTGAIDVFDSHFQATSVPGQFVDTAVPAGLIPFNIQAIGSNLVVTFADGATPPVFGRGLGAVDVFDTGGHLLMRLKSGEAALNAPWGIAMAPSDFGELSNRLLVGNLGSGRIAAFDTATGEFVGFLHGSRGALSIDGLWAIAFGGGNATDGAANTLFFTAGIDGLKHGLFGTITPQVKNLGEKDNDAEEQNDEQNEKR
jgi:uncharacterized protein (TIGR03118 family)